MKRLYFASLPNCNQRCVFCVRLGDDDPIKYIQTKEAKNILATKVEEDYEEIIFDGGEPTLRSDLPDLIEYAHQSGYKKVVIVTNGVKLADKNLILRLKKILEQGIDISFSVSLHSHQEALSDKLTATPGTYKKTIQGIDNLFTCGFEHISVYNVITVYNFKLLPDYVEFVNKRFPKIPSITFSFIYPAGAAKKNLDLYPRLSEVEPYFLKALKKCEKFNLNYNITTCGTIPLCFLRGYEKLLVDQQNLDNKNVGLFDSAQNGKFKLASKEFHEKTKVKGPQCKKCALDHRCGGIWQIYVKKYGLSELRPVSFNPLPSKTLLLLTGYACNNNCAYCSTVASPRNNPSTEYLVDEIKKGFDEGFDNIEFLGGEPTIRPDFFELLKMAKKTGYQGIAITTNGRMFAYEDFCQQAKEAGLNQAVFSLHGHNKILHDGATRTPGSFDQCVKGIKNLLAVGSNDVAINTVVVKTNVNKLNKLAEFLLDLGIKKWHLLELLPDGLGEENYKIYYVGYNEVYKSLEKLFFLLAEFYEVELFDFPLCSIPKNISELKNIHLITAKKRQEFTQRGENAEPTRIDTIVEAGGVIYLDKYKIKPLICRKCLHYNDCGGVAKPYYDQLSDSEIKELTAKQKFLKTG